jgi:hypothetical protein
MAPLPEIADTYRVVFNWNVDNIVNVTHFHADEKTPKLIYDAIEAHVTDNMWSTNLNSHKITSVEVTPLDGTGATYTKTTDASSKWGGTLSGDAIMNCASVLSQHTVFRGPANRGRMFIGPMAEGALSNGIINTATRGAMESAWTTFQIAMIGADIQHVVASYRHQTAITVLNYSVREAAGTMRRRQSRLAA